MNVLITSVGRRAYIVKYFKEALNGSGKVFVSNSDALSSAFEYADESVVSPLIYDADYIPFLLDYCRRKKIDVLISVFDMDLSVLAANKNRFAAAGVSLIVSDADVISVCNDKWLTYKYLTENGFDTPLTFLNLDDTVRAVREGRLAYPVIVKPRFGCGSIGVETAYDEADVRYLDKRVRRIIAGSYLKYETAEEACPVLFQECIRGEEYGVDIINDLSGTFRNAVIHKKLAMRSGETDICELVDNEIILRTARRLGTVLRHIANLDCDMILSGQKAYVLEMNARIGGVYPFSHMAGCNLPLAIVKWVNQEDVPLKLLSARTGTAGFKELVITQKKATVQKT